MLVYEKHKNGAHYQVRTAGSSVRLYRNGVLHTQWNPRHPLKGSLWELFLLAAIVRADRQLNQVAILGMGGGSIVNLLYKYLQPKNLIAVELDPLHVWLAKRYFGTSATGVQVATEDARHWIGRQPDARYDILVDDLFGESDGQPVRNAPIKMDWYLQVLAKISGQGVAMFNFADRSEWQRSGLKKVLRKVGHGSVVRLSHAKCENVVICYYQKSLTLSDIKMRLSNSSAHRLAAFIEDKTYSIKVLTGRRQLR